MTSTRLAVLVAVVLAGLMSHGTFAGSGDEPHYLVISHSIAFDGDLDMALADEIADVILLYQNGSTLDTLFRNGFE